MTSKDLFIDTTNLKKAYLVLRALNHKLRQKLLSLIDKSQQTTVTELYIKLRLEQSVVSQHLAILRNAGVVNTERNGKYINYSINYYRIKQVEQLCKDIIKISIV